MRKVLSGAGLCLYGFFIATTFGQTIQRDPSFNPGSGPNGIVRSIVPLADSSILVGGDFSIWSGQRHGSVVRLSADGSVDPTFQADVNLNVRQLFVQQGEVLAVGDSAMVRLFADGTRDTNFPPLLVSGPVAGTEDFLYTVFVPPRPRPILELRHPDGTFIDTIFTGSVGDQVRRLVPYPGNRVLFLGRLSFGAIVLFGPNGLESTFQSPPARESFNAAVAPDNSIYAALRFDGAATEFSIRRLNQSGQVDTNFADAGGVAAEFASMAVQNDGRLLYGARTVRRLNLDGTPDTTFDPGFAASTIHAIAVQPDGKILVGGNLDNINGQALPNIVRLLPDPAAPGPPTNPPPDPGLTISGRVTDGENGVPNVKVQTGRRNSVFTDDTGSYVLVVPKRGRYVVRPSAPGTRFTPPSRRVRVRDDVVLPDFIARQRR